MEKNLPPIPEGLDLVPGGVNVIIRRRWFTHTVWFLVFFCSTWDSCLVFWYYMALTKGPHGVLNLMTIVFPVVHVAVGIGLTYFVICTFINKTDISFSRNQLRVSIDPLPWLGNVTLKPSDISSFSVRARLGSRNGSAAFDVMYVDINNRQKTLVKGLPTEEQAEYIRDVLSLFYFPQEKNGYPAAK